MYVLGTLLPFIFALIALTLKWVWVPKFTPLSVFWLPVTHMILFSAACILGLVPDFGVLSVTEPQC